MTNAQKLALRLSALRQKLNELSAKDELTDGEQNEMRSLSAEFPTVEERWRAATLAEGAEEAAAAGEDADNPGDGENRERRELRGRCRVGRYMSAALDGLPVGGAEAELSAAAGCPGSVPLELFEVRAGGGDGEPGGNSRSGDHGREPCTDRPGNLRSLGGVLARHRNADGRHRRRGLCGSLNGRDRRRGGEKRAGGGNGGRVHGDDGATAADLRRVPVHGRGRGAALRHGGSAAGEHRQRAVR